MRISYRLVAGVAALLFAGKAAAQTSNPVLDTYLSARSQITSARPMQLKIIDGQTAQVTAALDFAALSIVANRHGSDSAMQLADENYVRGSGMIGQVAPALAANKIKFIEIGNQTDDQIANKALKQINGGIIKYISNANSGLLDALRMRNDGQAFADSLKKTWGGSAVNSSLVNRLVQFNAPAQPYAYTFRP